MSDTMWAGMRGAVPSSHHIAGTSEVRTPTTMPHFQWHVGLASQLSATARIDFSAGQVQAPHPRMQGTLVQGSGVQVGMCSHSTPAIGPHSRRRTFVQRQRSSASLGVCVQDVGMGAVGRWSAVIARASSSSEPAQPAEPERAAQAGKKADEDLQAPKAVTGIFK